MRRGNLVGDRVGELDVHPIRKQVVVDIRREGQIKVADVPLGEADEMRVAHGHLSPPKRLTVDPGRRLRASGGRPHIHAHLS